MAPTALESNPVTEAISNLKISGGKLQKEPVKPTGILDKYESFDVTPIIGREFKDVNLVEWLRAPNSDELLRELAYTISSRNVVFFRAQDDLTNDLQKELIQRLGEVTGKPETSKLHIHPILNSGRELGGSDPEISTISSEQRKNIGYEHRPKSTLSPKKQNADNWHSDIPFEPVPADYTSLRLVELPSTGGDTVWASGYDLYDRISTPYQKFLEGLTVTFAQPMFNEIAARNGFPIYSEPRGAPENIGEELTAVHPLIRTNPVTGWKSLFAAGHHISHINDVTEDESKELLAWFRRLIFQNHDLQVRFKWQNKNDIAIWDNRSTFHAATFDYEGLGPRFGNRAVGLGERPYFDPNSTSRSETLGKQESVGRI